MSVDDHKVLWRRGAFTCVMVSCCAGAELQMRDGEQIVLREMYPTRSDAYERARMLEERTAGSLTPDLND